MLKPTAPTKSLEGYEQGWRHYWDAPEWQPLGHVNPNLKAEPNEINAGVTWVEVRRDRGWNGVDGN